MTQASALTLEQIQGRLNQREIPWRAVPMSGGGSAVTFTPKDGRGVSVVWDRDHPARGRSTTSSSSSRRTSRLPRMAKATVVVTAIHNRTKETITIPHQHRGPIKIEPGGTLEGPFIYTYDPDDADDNRAANGTGHPCG